MKNKIAIAPEAQQDLDEIYDYILFDLGNPAAALRMIDKIMDAIDQLATFPHLGAPLSSIAKVESKYRFFVTDNYTTFYRVMGDTVFVDRVLYGRRDYLRILLG